MTTLAYARYGKSNVRVLRVVRNAGEGREDVAEFNVQLLVEGKFETSFTEADNTCVVATDSMKNIIYALAKTSPHVLTPELFGVHLGVFMLQKYSHLTKAHVNIERLKWSRILVQGKPHGHSFVRDGEEKHTVEVVVDGSVDKQKLGVRVKSGIKDLLVLKSTGSAFENFYRDEYTTLVEVSDRIFSTSVDATWDFEAVTISGPDDLPALGEKMQYAAVTEHAKTVTLEIFATDESASVQATLFKIGTKLLEGGKAVKTATYTLPNKHYVPVDMNYLGIKNVSPPAAAEVFVPLAAPSGHISATVGRA